jgi:hypothetical protein
MHRRSPLFVSYTALCAQFGSSAAALKGVPRVTVHGGRKGSSKRDGGAGSAATSHAQPSQKAEEETVERDWRKVRAVLARVACWAVTR